ncbi:MAG: MarR family transcriptional regulator [Usitatibacteraceae bacterium]
MHLFDSHPFRGAFVANTLERLAWLIVDQGETVLRDAGLAFPSRAASTVLLLGESKRLSAADLAKALGQPHQLVTQRVDLLIELGIVSRAADDDDARRRILVLTPKGKRQFEKLKAHLVLAEAAFAALFAEIGYDLSGAALSAIAALERSPLQERVRTLEMTDPVLKEKTSR